MTVNDDVLAIIFYVRLLALSPEKRERERETERRGV